MLLRLALLLALLLGACSSADGPTAERDPIERDLSAPIQTDRLVYTLEVYGEEPERRRYDFTVVAAFENTTAEPVVIYRNLPQFPPPYYELWLMEEGAREGTAYNGIMFTLQHDNHVVVPPGAVRVDTLRVSGPAIQDARTGEYEGAIEGRMRLEYELRGCAQPCPWEGGRLTSNEFVVRLP